MTKLTKSVRATIKDVVEKQEMPGSSEMIGISAQVIRDHLREDHGIFVRIKTILQIAQRFPQRAYR